MNIQQAERVALMRSITDEPNDDVPRLVMADWLEEQGETERAEYIRAAIAHAHLSSLDPHGWTLQSRLQRLEHRWFSVWRDELPPIPNILWRNFHRGFMDSVRVYESTALRYRTPSLFDAAPITRLSGLLVEDEVLFECDRLPQLRTLDCGGPGDYSLRLLPRLANHPGLADLESLYIDRGAHHDDLIHYLTEECGWPGLRHLDLGGNLFTSSALRQLANWPTLRQMETIAMNDGDLHDRDIIPWLHELDRNHLQALHLLMNRITDESIPVLVEHPWPMLDTLMLSFNELSAEGIEQLAGTNHLPSLARLGLMGNQMLGDRGVIALAECAQLRLRVLSLGICHFGEAGLRALFRAPWLPHLQRLDLCEFRFQRLGSRWLAEAPLNDLRYLEIPACPIGDDELEIILSAEWIGQLTHLVLHHNLIGDRGARALVSHPKLERLTHLDLSRNPISPESLAALQYRFGDGLIV